MTKSKAFLLICLSFMGGIFLNSFFPAYRFPLLMSLFSIFVLLALEYKKFLLSALCFLFLILGVWRHQSFLFRVENNSLEQLINREGNIALVGIIDSLPDRRENFNKIKIRLPEKEGKILITSWKYPEYRYGDKLKLEGKLEEPENFEDFDYKNYLAKDGIYAVMYFPDIELIGKGFGSPFFASLFSIKNRLKESVNSLLPSPQSGLLEALLFGDEENIPEYWKQKFNITGTRHIAAVSGMNITIISVLILNLLLFMGFWRKQAFYLSVGLILIYVLVIGAPASGLRAAIMGILFLLAQSFGRASDGVRPIVFSACLMLFQNPLLLKADVGFQLSFLAILGLAYLQPFFSNFLKRIPDFFQLRYTLSATIAAQIFTFPVLAYHFGQVSVLGLFSNLLVVPLLPHITILGFFLSLSGIFFLPLGYLLSFPAWALLTFILKIIDFSFQIPLSPLSFQNFSLGWVIIFYLGLGFIVWRLQESQKLRFLYPEG